MFWPQLAKYEASQLATKLNAIQKEIGTKKKVSSVLENLNLPQS